MSEGGLFCSLVLGLEARLSRSRPIRIRLLTHHQFTLLLKYVCHYAEFFYFPKIGFFVAYFQNLLRHKNVFNGFETSIRK